MTYYYEKVTSRRTQSLFLALTLLFLWLSLRRISIRRRKGARRDRLNTVFAGASLFFLAVFAGVRRAAGAAVL